MADSELLKRDAARASLVVLMKRGNATAARMPMIAITTISSIMVKPACLLIRDVLIYLLNVAQAPAAPRRVASISKRHRRLNARAATPGAPGCINSR